MILVADVIKPNYASPEMKREMTVILESNWTLGIRVPQDSPSDLQSQAGAKSMLKRIDGWSACMCVHPSEPFHRKTASLSLTSETACLKRLNLT
jgi:hypothetical protein